MNSKVYKQGNSKWASKPYPTKKSSFGGHGCGCVSCVHIAIEQSSKWNWTPESLRPYMVKKGYAVAGHGTTWQGIYNTLKYLGHKNVVWVKRNEPMSKAFKELDKGNRMCIFLFNSKKAPSGVRWTAGGHYVAAVQYKKDSSGKHLFYTKDSGGRNHTGWYSYERDMAGCVSQVWVCEKINIPKPYVITKPYTGKLPSKTVKKGSKGTDVKAVQTFLNWCLGIKLAVDGKCGSKTTSAIKKYQKQYKLKVDGIFGSQSKKKAQEIIKAHAPKPAPTPKPTVTNADKIVAKAKEYAWAYGTASSKYSYSKGAPKAVYKTALKKQMGKTAKISQSDCGYFVSTVVREVLHNNFLALKKANDKFVAPPKDMTIVSTGKVGTLKAGDIIRYKKSSGQHTVIYIGNGYIAHASRGNAFPRISKSSPWNNSNVKKGTIQVIRAK